MIEVQNNLMVRVYAALDAYEEDESLYKERQYLLLQDLYTRATVKGQILSHAQLVMIDEVLQEVGY